MGARLLDEWLPALSGRQPHDLELRAVIDNLESLRADGPGRAEDHDPSHGAPSLGREASCPGGVWRPGSGRCECRIVLVHPEELHDRPDVLLEARATEPVAREQVGG